MSFSPRVALASLAVLASSVAFGQAKPSPEIVRWQPSKTSAVALAKKTDSAIARIQRGQVEAKLMLVMPKRRGQGQMVSVSEFKDAKNLKVSYPLVSFTHLSELNKVTLKSDGTKAMLLVPEKPTRTAAAGTFRLAKGATPDGWGINHAQYILGAITGDTPLTTFFGAVSKPGAGYVTKVEERSYRRMGKVVRQYRVMVERTATATKKKGYYHVEFTIDGNLYLPVRVAASVSPTGKEKVLTQNRLTWRTRAQAFEPGYFSLSRKSKKS